MLPLHPALLSQPDYLFSQMWFDSGSSDIFHFLHYYHYH